MRFLIAGLIFLALLSGCIDEGKKELVPLNKTITCNRPYILVSGSCCLDMNDNGICDMKEISTTTSLEETTTTTKPPKERGYELVQNQNETNSLYLTTCDKLINETRTKPATKTVKLCLSNREYVSFSGMGFRILDLEKEGIKLKIYDNGTYGEKSISNKSDLLIGNISMRLVGSFRDNGGFGNNSTLYAKVYAWITEGVVSCSTNLDCGDEELIGYSCSGNDIVKEILYHRCINNPGTVVSYCQAIQKNQHLDSCGTSKRCSGGDDECFPKGCFNGKQDQDEEHVDCGGSCRPCHCFNEFQDKGEKGIDCDGGCRPCTSMERDKTPPDVIIVSPKDIIYNKQVLDLRYNVNELTSWCGYSLNGKENATTKGSDIIYAKQGLNELTLYCNDTSGNMQSVKQQFTVLLLQSQICPGDNVSTAYSGYFDNVTFYGDTEDNLGVPDRCTKETFGYSLSFNNDTEIHETEFDATDSMNDSEFSILGHPIITYDCRETGKLKINYVKVQKNINPIRLSRIKAIIYFYENKPAGRSNVFWRIYPYALEEHSVNSNEYLDIPYRPVESRCNTGMETMYQEIDLTSLLEKMKTGDLDFRIGLYTSMMDSEIRIMEMELYTGYKLGK